MFTPPPSPDPPRTHRGRRSLSLDAPKAPYLSVTRSSSQATASSRSSTTPPPPPSSCLRTRHAPLDEAYVRKRRNARRLKLSVLAVPLALFIITLSTRYISHPAVLDFLSADEAAQGWNTFVASMLDWEGHVHEPHDKRDVALEGELQVRSPQIASGITFPSQADTGSSTALSASTATSGLTASETLGSAAPTASTTATGSSTIPTIPSEPPVLPTPFPQPFDSTGITTNFSTNGCRNFFLNMTQTAPFRECRPFSMLILHSSAFIEAQFNLSELNSVVWGTCNTDLSVDQCEANMAWFADALQDACATDLAANNQVATSSLLGLQTYSVMRQAACLNSTDAYCYVSAFSSEAHPADAYYYTLPLGTALPNTSDPSCSLCTQDTMTEYVNYGLNTSGLRQTYENAAVVTNKVCGARFVPEMVVVHNSAAGEGRLSRGARWWAAVSVCVLGMILGLGGASWQ